MTHRTDHQPTFTGAIAYIQDTIELKEDVGTFEPVYKRVTLNLMSDGTVHWTGVKIDAGF